jgi:hypothetical protein
MPLHYTALRGDLALFVLLFSASAPALAAAPAAGAALLTAAIRGGSSEMVGIVLLTGATSPAKCREAGQMPVHAAAREGCLDVLQYLFGAGFDMAGESVVGSTGQCHAVPCMHRHVCNGARGAYTPQPHVSRPPAWPLTLYLLPTACLLPRAELDSERKSPLHHAPIGCGQAAVAARRGADHRQVAEALVASGCRVDSQDAHGCTPLHFAAGVHLCLCVCVWRLGTPVLPCLHASMLPSCSATAACFLDLSQRHAVTSLLSCRRGCAGHADSLHRAVQWRGGPARQHWLDAAVLGLQQRAR